MPDRRYTILHLDDEESLGQCLQEELQRAGYDAHYEPSKAAGYDWILEHHPDLIISDINSPGLDGLQFLHWIKLNPTTRHVPFMFITAFADLRTAIQSRKLGVDEFISKPFDVQDLLVAIERVLATSWSPSIYPPPVPFDEIVRSRDLEFQPWAVIDSLCRRLPEVWAERMHHVGASENWASFFVVETGKDLVACCVDRPLQFRLMSAERVLCHHRWMREIGADYGMLMGFFEPDDRARNFARQLGIELIGGELCQVALSGIGDQGEGGRERLLDFLRINLTSLDDGPPFTAFAEKVERELTQFIGKRFKIYTPVSPSHGVAKNVALKHAGSDGLQFDLLSEPGQTLRLDRTAVWTTLADLWSKGMVARQFIDQRPEHAASLFELLAHVPSIDRDDDSLRLRDKPVRYRAHRQLVAVLDDNDNERGWMCDFLRSSGYSVIGFQDKNDYLDLLLAPRAVLPNLVITDLHSPGLSGEEFIRILRGHGRLRSIPIMVVSRHLDAPHALSNLRHLGVTAFLRKPCELPVLLDAVGRSLSRAA